MTSRGSHDLPPQPPETLNDFEQWLDVNYRSPYNIRFKYKLEDSETDLQLSLYPCRLG